MSDTSFPVSIEATDVAALSAALRNDIENMMRGVLAERDAGHDPVRFLVVVFCADWDEEQRGTLGKQLEEIFSEGAVGGLVAWLILPGADKIGFKVLDLAEGRLIL